MFTVILTQAIRFWLVFLYGSTGEIIIEKSGHLNLGIPGIMCLGAVGGCIGANLAVGSGSTFLIILTGILFVTDDQNFYHINYDEFKNHHK